jgi:hypothetical protein
MREASCSCCTARPVARCCAARIAAQHPAVARCCAASASALYSMQCSILCQQGQSPFRPKTNKWTYAARHGSMVASCGTARPHPSGSSSLAASNIAYQAAAAWQRRM